MARKNSLRSDKEMLFCDLFCENATARVCRTSTSSSGAGVNLITVDSPVSLHYVCLVTTDINSISLESVLLFLFTALSLPDDGWRNKWLPYMQTENTTEIIFRRIYSYICFCTAVFLANINRKNVHSWRKTQSVPILYIQDCANYWQSVVFWRYGK